MGRFARYYRRKGFEELVFLGLAALRLQLYAVWLEGFSGVEGEGEDVYVVAFFGGCALVRQQQSPEDDIFGSWQAGDQLVDFLAAVMVQNHLYVFHEVSLILLVLVDEQLLEDGLLTVVEVFRAFAWISHHLLLLFELLAVPFILLWLFDRRRGQGALQLDVLEEVS